MGLFCHIVSPNSQELVQGTNMKPTVRQVLQTPKTAQFLESSTKRITKYARSKEIVSRGGGGGGGRIFKIFQAMRYSKATADNKFLINFLIVYEFLNSGLFRFVYR